MITSNAHYHTILQLKQMKCVEHVMFLMKMELKGKNDDQIEDYLQDVINIFRCVTNKVVFQYEYVKKLSERMLNKKTVSIVAEKNLISKLKAEQGVTYVNRFSSISLIKKLLESTTCNLLIK